MKQLDRMSHIFEFESTGRHLCLDRSDISIHPIHLKLFCGGSGRVLLNNRKKQSFTHAERKELGEYMINLWQQFIERGAI